MKPGVTKQSNEITSNEVTRNRVTGKKIEGSKKLKIEKSKNKPFVQILFIFNFFVTEARIIEVPFSGACTYFLDCTRYFLDITSKEQLL